MINNFVCPSYNTDINIAVNLGLCLGVKQEKNDSIEYPFAISFLMMGNNEIRWLYKDTPSWLNDYQKIVINE